MHLLSLVKKQEWSISAAMGIDVGVIPLEAGNWAPGGPQATMKPYSASQGPFLRILVSECKNTSVARVGFNSGEFVGLCLARKKLN